MWNPTKQTLTWEHQISQDDVFSLIGIADFWKVGVQDEEHDTAQKGQNSNSHSVAAGLVVGVEHALDLILCDWVSVAFSCDGGKNHDGKYLRRTNTVSLPLSWGALLNIQQLTDP